MRSNTKRTLLEYSTLTKIPVEESVRDVENQ